MEYFGIYRGKVTNNIDHEGLMRLSIQVPDVNGGQELTNVWPCLPFIDRASWRTPNVNAPIWVMFEAGDIEHPVWIGTWKLIGE